MEVEKEPVEDVSGWLRVYSDGSVDRTWNGPREAKFMTEAVPAHKDEFRNGVAVKDVFTGNESDAQVRIYLPEKTTGETRLPILLHFHGGGFCISHPDWYIYYAVYTRIAKAANAICVSVYLRRAPEHRLPAACDDGFSSLLWLQRLARGENHEPWMNAHGDFSRIFLIGDSSGGNIVHHVAARAGEVDLSPAKIAGAIPIHPGFCRAKKSRSEMENPETPFLTRDMADKFLELALPIGCDKDHPIICPMGSAAPPMENLRLPPFLLCAAEKDLLWDTNMEYYNAMKRAKKEVTLFVSYGMSHSFYLNAVGVATDPATALPASALFDSIVDFVNNH